MSTSTSTVYGRIQIDRITNLSELDDRKRITCPLCQGVLWYPIGCKHCQGHYCSKCLRRQQSDSSEPFKCPSSNIVCPGFEERKCHAKIKEALSDLTFKCVNISYNCDQILPYDKLEEHEKNCGFQQESCSGCKNYFAKSSLPSHIELCPLIEQRCLMCNYTYRRQDQDKHDRIACLQEQVNYLRNQVNILMRERNAIM